MASDPGGQHMVMNLEADNANGDFDDADSALGDEMSVWSSTASLRSSIMRTRLENGRRYHAYREGKYVLPMDQEELDRQEYQYHLCQYTFNDTLAFAPIDKDRIHRVLDVGCGVGFWAMEFGERHPSAQVIGVDLSPVQESYVPCNVQFEIDDLEEEWTFSYKFDYIHSMMMTGAFRDWPRFYSQAFEFLNPGGWVEIQDIQFPLKCDDGSLPEGSALKQWSDMMMRAGEISGFRLDTCAQAAAMMHDAGFVDIRSIPFVWPMNEWAKDPRYKMIGGWVRENFTSGAEAMMLALFTRFMGWTKERVEDFTVELKRDLRDLSKHTYFELWVTFGRKP